MWAPPSTRDGVDDKRRESAEYVTVVAQAGERLIGEERKEQQVCMWTFGSEMGVEKGGAEGKPETGTGWNCAWLEEFQVERGGDRQWQRQRVLSRV